MNEQDRINRLSEAIDRLMDGKRPLSNDPLLKVARQLAHMKLQPRPTAHEKFEHQLTQWFGTNVLHFRRVPIIQRSLAALTLLAAVGASIALLATLTRIASTLPVASVSPEITPTLAILSPPLSSPTPTKFSVVTPTATAIVRTISTQAACATYSTIPTDELDHPCENEVTDKVVDDRDKADMNDNSTGEMTNLNQPDIQNGQVGTNQPDNQNGQVGTSQPDNQNGQGQN
ncbi:MAG: hypothetical protein ACYDBJ_21850 [Aggregatilineales bacterium]